MHPKKTLTDRFKEWTGNHILVFILFTVIFAVSLGAFYRFGYNNGLDTGKLSSKQIRNMINYHPKVETIVNSDIQLKIATIEERNTALGKRFDDLYIFSPIILGLLGIILAGVYIRSEHDVNKHMAKNFEAHKSEMEDHLSNANDLVSQIQAQLSLAKDMNQRPAENGLMEEEDGNNG